MSFRSLALSVLVGIGMVAAATAQDFPVSIDHAYGTTTIDAQPIRVVT